jgi:hypothetical protein
MAKKQSFADKAKKSEQAGAREMIKWVKAVKTKDGDWKFRTQMVGVTDENRKEFFN